MESSFPSFFHSNDLQYVMMKNVPYWVISLLLLQRCFHVFSVFVLTEAPEVWQCCLLLCWAENASVGLACCECWVQDWHRTLHTLLWDLSAQGQTGAGQHSLNSQTQEGLGVSAWKPPLHMGQPSLSGSLVHLWWGNLPGWWCGNAAALKGASSGLCHSRQHVGGGIPYCH